MRSYFSHKRAYLSIGIFSYGIVTLHRIYLCIKECRNEKNVQSNKKAWDIKVITSFGISLIFIGMVFYKMFVYEMSDLSFVKDKNVYVSGDVYNYIINANFSTAYFVLALIFAIIASSFLIYNTNMIQGEYKNV